MVINGFTLDGEWKNSSSGQIAHATRAGKKYFLKKYQTPVEPINNGSLDPKTYKANMDRFNKFVSIRAKVNRTIRSVAGGGGNIIIPASEFTYDNHYCEASEFIEGAVKDDELDDLIKYKLDETTKKTLLLAGTGALMSIHKLGIVHSDLKLKNILVVKTPAGAYAAKLIDFDNSYFPGDELPDEVVGDINYYSPELGTFANFEEDDEREAYGKNLTVKSDIFSLGLIFHYYLTGEPVTYADLNERLTKRQKAGKAIYPWTVLINDGRLVISDKIKSPNLRALISDMLERDPAKRPACIEILTRLKAKDDAPVTSTSTSTTKPSTSTTTVTKPVTPEVKKPEPKKAGYCDPWPEHSIALNVEKLTSRHFLAVEQQTLGSVKGYALISNLETGASMFFTVEKLVALGYAKVSDKPTPTETKAAPAPEVKTPEVKPAEEKPVTPTEGSYCEPYPEDNIAFDIDSLKAKGIVKVEQSEMGGVKGYNFVNASGVTRFLRGSMAVVLKYAIKK